MIVDWCLITSQEVPIGEYNIGITLGQFKTTSYCINILGLETENSTENYRWSNLTSLVAYAFLLYNPLIAIVAIVLPKREVLGKFVASFNLNLSLSSLPTGGTLCYCCLSNLKKWSTMIQMT